MAAQRFFITGTDTNVGKTYATVRLMQHYRAQGLGVLGLKPVASGAVMQQGTWVNEDGLHLQSASSNPLDYSIINPICFQPFIAPHIAAARLGMDLSAASLYQALQPALATAYDVCYVEGAGGWHTPLNTHETMADLAMALGFPVIIVVAIRLGCMSHAQLTAEAIARSSLPLAGWVANLIDPQTEARDEQIETVQHRIRAPYLGRIEYGKDFVPRLCSANTSNRIIPVKNFRSDGARPNDSASPWIC